MTPRLGGIYVHVSSPKKRPQYFVCMDYQEEAGVALFVDQFSAESDVYKWSSMKSANISKMYSFQKRALVLKVFGDKNKVANENAI
jgi:hypothetical protein